jgi:hypothetical protein
MNQMNFLGNIQRIQVLKHPYIIPSIQKRPPCIYTTYKRANLNYLRSTNFVCT